MGEAMISGFLRSKKYEPQDIRVFDHNKSRLEYINQKYNVICVQNPQEAVSFADLIIIAVKPKDMKEALKQVAEGATPNRIIISIAAGVTLDFLRKYLPKGIPHVRVMPNIACQVSEAMIAVCPSENTSIKDMKKVESTLTLLGNVIQLEEEYLSLATGLVGSGPAYIYIIIDALADAGVRLGLPKDVSILLAAQTTLGAAKMVVETGEHPAVLKDMVATPAGTTVEGILALEEGKIRSVIIKAVTKAAEKAKKLQPEEN